MMEQFVFGYAISIMDEGGKKVETSNILISEGR